MPISRKKSCVRCRQSKLKCNQAVPTCSRCSERGTRCIYDWKAGHTGPHPHPSGYRISREPSIPPRTFTDVTELQLEELNDDIALSTSAFIHSQSQTTEPGQQDDGAGLDWSAIDAAAEQTLSTTRLDSSLDMSSPPGPTTIWPGTQGLSVGLEKDTVNVERGPILDTFSDISNPWFVGTMVATLGSNRTSCAATFTDSRPPRRTFQRRHVLRHCALSSIVIGQVTNFPKMLIRGHHLPPFIAPPCHIHEELAFDCARSQRHQCLLKELAICSSLVEMFYSRTAQTADFVWKMIYAERDRLRREHESFDIYHQLAALQAVTIYILLRAQDVENSDDVENRLLLETVLEIALSATQRSKLDIEVIHQTPSREQWVHQESGRRTITVLLIINLMLDCLLETERHVYEASCRSSIETILLPATRDLWEAPTNFIWRTEYERYLLRRKTRGSLRLGDLLKLSMAGTLKDMSARSNREGIVDDILAWCEGVDSLGSLIWMIVPFQQWRMSDGMSEIW